MHPICAFSPKSKMPSSQNRKPYRPSSRFYGRPSGASRVDLIEEKEEDIRMELVEDIAHEAPDEAGPKAFRWLSTKRSMASYERCLWVSAVVVLSVLCVVLGVQLGKTMGRPSSREDTDLESIGRLVTEEKRRFHTTADVLENGTSTFSTVGLKYVGPPSQAIDDSWKELMQPQILALSDEEAGELRDLSIMNDFGKRIMSLSVYHTLHCLNMVRKSFDFEYYYVNKSEHMGDNYRDHVYHCIDDIRQNIMCHNDLTPVPFYWNIYQQWPVSNTSQLHTCRNHETIRKWAMERRVGKGGSPLGLPVAMK